MASGQEIVSLAKTIVGYCQYESREGYGGAHLCNRGFIIHYSGGSLEVKPGNIVTISEESLVVKESKPPELNTEEGFGGMFKSMLGTALGYYVAPEHTLLWSTITRISRT